jgi:hypothetical protein
MHSDRASRLLPVLVGCLLCAGASPSQAAPPVTKAPTKLPSKLVSPGRSAKGLPPGPTTSPIDTKHKALGGDAGILGKATSTEAAGANGGRYRHYQHGSIFWSAETGAHEIHGLIHGRYKALGWEKSWLGYPMTDEIDTYANEGRVNKFVGGELLWRRATNAVSDIKSTDLEVDLPTGDFDPWLVLEANGGSHVNPWAYCYDLVWNGDQPQTKGKKNYSSATAKVVWVEDEHSGPAINNGVAQRLGVGRYASTLHMITGSYQKHHKSGLEVIPQAMRWEDRPVLASGSLLSETGDVGVSKQGAYHIHYCITTAPDFSQFGPFESVPFVFRNYDVSKDGGKTWKAVTTGSPRKGDWVRRRPGLPKAAKVTSSVDTVDFGKVRGKVRLPNGTKGAVGGKVSITVMSEWGEPLAEVTYTTTALNADGPWSYDFGKVPNFPGSRVVAKYTGNTTPSASIVDGKSSTFDLEANTTRTVDVTLTATKIK